MGGAISSLVTQFRRWCRLPACIWPFIVMLPCLWSPLSLHMLMEYPRQLLSSPRSDEETEAWSSRVTCDITAPGTSSGQLGFSYWEWLVLLILHLKKREKKNELETRWRNSSLDKYLNPGTEGRAVCKVDSASCGVSNGVRGFWGWFWCIQAFQVQGHEWVCLASMSIWWGSSS